MTYSAKIKLSRHYYSEGYEQCQRYKDKRLLVSRVIGLMSVAGAIYLLISQSDPPALSIVLFGIAGAALLGNPIQKFFWLRGLEKGKRFNKEVEFVFDESGISTNGPFATGNMSWEGIEKQLRTPKGLLLWPQKGIYLYFPESHVDRRTIEYIQSKVG